MVEGVSKSFRTGRPERELQVAQLSVTKCSCVAIFWVSPVSFAAITLCIASQRVFVVVYFVIDSVRKLFDIPSERKLSHTCAGILFVLSVWIVYLKASFQQISHAKKIARKKRKKGIYEVRGRKKILEKP
jgi:hypothetical protein